MSRIRVGIVNDVRLALEVLRRIVASDPELEVCWTAMDGQEAIDRCAADLPDIVLMDLIMPRLDGVAATRTIMAHTPCPILVVTATVQGNRNLVYEAMGCGALDVVATPTMGEADSAREAQALLRKIHSISTLARSGRRGERTPRASAAPVPGEPVAPLVAIGCSTGGPAAVETILQALPANFSAAIVVVQHIDSEFVDGFVTWLNGRTRLSVRLAQRGDPLRPGEVLVADSQQHLSLVHGGRVTYVDGPPGALYRPSVDVFFQSAARHAPPGSCGVLLTGLGRDGAEGLLAMRRAGIRTVAQDRATSVVYGMPGAAAELGAADVILPVGGIADYLVTHCSLRKRT